MSDRIATPIDPVAFLAAQRDFEARYGENLHLVPGTSAHRKKRAAWLRLYAAHGGAVDDGTTFQSKLPGVAVEPCPLKNVVESVSFLTGAAPLTADAVQHVNLPRDAKFVDGVRVPHLDRLGRTLRVQVRFRRAKREQFKVALLAHRDNATYSGPEQGRRPAYACPRAAAAPNHVQGAFTHYQGAVFTGTTGKNGRAVVEGHFEVPVAGGDRYTLVAWDVNGNVVSSLHDVATTRTLYYATFLADDPNHVRVDQAWFRNQIEAAYRAHHVGLVHVGTETLAGIVYHDIVMQTALGNAVRDRAAARTSTLGRRYPEYAPYLIRFAFVDQCAGVLRKTVQPVRFVGANPGDVLSAPIYNNTPQQRLADPVFDWRKCLWAGMGQPLYDGDRTTTGHEWYESATLTSHRGGGDVTVNLAATDLTPVARVGAPGALVEVRFTVPGDFPAATDVTFSLTAVIVNRTVMGQSMQAPYAGTTIQPARGMFVAIDPNKQLSSAIHECGHAIGMVADPQHQGVGHGTMYDHQGRHCWHGVAGPAGQVEDYHRPPLKDTGTCVMYGLIPDAGANLAFCADCAEVLRKLDLSDGFTG